MSDGQAFKPWNNLVTMTVNNISRGHYARVVTMLVRRELKVKYRGTFFGYLWSMLNPLLFMLIISFVFSHLMRGIQNYSLFVLAGILFWNLTAASIIAGTNSIVANASLIQKVKVPLWVFPLVPLGSSAVNLCLALVPFLIISVVLSASFTLNILLLPVIVGLTATFLAGVALALSALNVFFRDVGHVLEPVLTLAFYATPVIYDRNGASVPPHISNLLGFNPLTHFAEAFRSTLVSSAPRLTLSSMLLLCLFSADSLVLGTMVYRNCRNKIPFRL